MESKGSRQQCLANLLKEQEFFSQEEICKAIQARGFEVTQPSVSRDLTEIGVVRIAGRYLPASALNQRVSKAEVATLTLAIDTAGPNLIIIRTKTGSANAVAYEIDSLESKEVVGTVAGDDTIFVAVKSKAAQTKLIRDLKNLLQDQII